MSKKPLRINALGLFSCPKRSQNCGQVFRYAVATARAETDPSRDLRGALTPWKPEHYATLTDSREVGRLLRDMDAHEGGFVTKCALKLAPMLFVRPGELRRAEWVEINLEAAEWRIPAEKMKARVMHIVPLARQAVDILRELQALTGKSHWVFPGLRTNGEPISENTINAALRRMSASPSLVSIESIALLTLAAIVRWRAAANACRRSSVPRRSMVTRWRDGLATMHLSCA
jgi:integrase